MVRLGRWGAIATAAAMLAACNKTEAPAPDVRPVRTIVVERKAQGETLSLTGQIRAQDEVNLAFRLDGRMIERKINVGDKVTPGQIVAKLDPQTAQNSLRSAEASFSAAQGQLTQAQNTFQRQQALLAQGFTTRVQFDQAQQALQTAQAQVDSAQAQLASARDQLDYTELLADAGGSVTAVGAQPGEVVRAGQSIVKVARQGGRDAVVGRRSHHRAIVLVPPQPLAHQALGRVGRAAHRELPRAAQVALHALPQRRHQAARRLHVG